MLERGGDEQDRGILTKFLFNTQFHHLSHGCNKASDPRDVIFAAYGYHAMPPFLKPDYTPSVEEVYERAARAYVAEWSKERNLVLIFGLGNGVENFHERDNLCVSSWIPDWRRPTKRAQFGRWADGSGRPDLPFRAGHKHPHRLQLETQSGRLHVKGRILGRVRFVSNIELEPSLVCNRTVADWLHLAELKEEVERSPWAAEPITEERIFQTLVADQKWILYTSGLEEDSPWEAYQRARNWRTGGQYVFGALASILPTRLIPEEAKVDLKILWESNRRYIENCQLAIKQTTDILLHRRIAVTSAGTLALVASSVVFGDHVAILHGAHMPIILRSESANRYWSVGEAYVEGISKGEAVTWTEEEADDLVII